MKLNSMDIERYSEVVEGDGKPYACIHLSRLDFTLCGVALESERGLMLRTHRRVTCMKCIGIVRYCKLIPNSVLNPPVAVSSQDRGTDG